MARQANDNYCPMNRNGHAYRSKKNYEYSKKKYHYTCRYCKWTRRIKKVDYRMRK